MLFSVLKYLLPREGALCMDILDIALLHSPTGRPELLLHWGKTALENKVTNHSSISEEILAPLVLIFALKIAA